MTKKLLLSAMIATGLAFAPAALAEDAMKKNDNMTKPMGDNMKKNDNMAKPAADNMKKPMMDEKKATPDAMKK